MKRKTAIPAIFKDNRSHENAGEEAVAGMVFCSLKFTQRLSLRSLAGKALMPLRDFFCTEETREAGRTGRGALRIFLKSCCIKPMIPQEKSFQEKSFIGMVSAKSLESKWKEKR